MEWDLKPLVVFPKGAVARDLPKVVVRMPLLGEEVIVGAQVVSDEMEKKEYLWKFVNENGSPKMLFEKDPDEL